jgi:hypothetical protein
LTAGGLRGKVVLISFWTYTCINWLRSLPYVRAWAEEYKEQGLVVVWEMLRKLATEQRKEIARKAAKARWDEKWREES